MTSISKTKVFFNDFTNTVNTEVKKAISKLDSKVEKVLKQVFVAYENINKPIANHLNGKKIAQKDGQEVDCCVGCCQCCAELTRGCCWQSF